jgi:hypothetical protein
MSEIKLIFCVVIGVLMANGLTYYGYKYLTEDKNKELVKPVNVSKTKPDSENFHEDFDNVKKTRIIVTIRNNSENQLTCGKMVGSQYVSFLTLEEKKKELMTMLKKVNS